VEISSKLLVATEDLTHLDPEVLED